MDHVASATRPIRHEIWGDPWRKLRTLESFARTEADGGRDIAAAATIVSDADLRQHLLRHAQDEVRHAEMFHRRATELRSTVASNPVVATESERMHDLSRGRPTSEVDSHGFLKFGLIDELGEVAYVAMLHVAEKKAAALFAQFERQTADDPATQALFTAILKDEKYHVAYTGRCLELWRKSGRSAEVEQAMRLAKGSRILATWRRAGMRAAAAFGRVVLRLLYFTLLAPFGWMARRKPLAGGWSVPPTRSGAMSDRLMALRQQS